MCDDFVLEVLTLLGMTSSETNNYMNGEATPPMVVKYIEKLPASSIMPGKASTIPIGWSVFYKKHDDGTGHMGFVYQGEDGKQIIIHNGKDLNVRGPIQPERVNIWQRTATDMDSFFSKSDPLNEHPAVFMPLMKSLVDF